MKLPTASALFRTLWWSLFAASLAVNVVALWSWSVCSSKLNDILETAEFNDLDGDGISNVIIKYK
jgi:hypothetical protein